MLKKKRGIIYSEKNEKEPGTGAFIFFTAADLFGGLNVKPAYAYDLGGAKPQNAEKMKITDVTKSFSKETLQDKTKGDLNESYNTKGKTMDPDKDVWVIVQMKSDSLLDVMSKRKSPSSIKDFALSNEGKSLSKQMINKQNDVKSAIGKKGIKASFKQNYTVLLNGFAANAKYKDIESIKGISGVSKVILSTTYYADSTDKDKENTILKKAVEENSKTTADSKQDRNKSDFKGSGMKVAVIDTGLDYNHSAFKKSPANYSMTKDTISKVFNNTIAYQETSCAVDNVFKSGKVPYEFDYADVDYDVMPTEASVKDYGNDHGTHVAGIIAGNDDKLTGVAPDAQLMIMKVFSDKSGGAGTTDILAALNDAVILGADVINMSLGSGGGFECEESDSLISRIYNAVSDGGINLVASAGNAFSSSYCSPAGDIPLASNPDTGIIGSPSSYDNALSVASINADAPKYITAGGKSVAYNDISGHSIINELKESSYKYVMVPGTGAPEDYKNIDVKGKIAVVKRGDLSFDDKQINAAAQGAAACFIYNNRSGGYMLNMSITDYKIPTAALSFEGGQALESVSDKVITINSKTQAEPLMSDYSAWGPLPNLTLKPEITAPGGNIYSSLPFEKYGYMSGTSMASPWIAGASGSVKQYIKQKYPSMSSKDVMVLVNRLLMSTAVPAYDGDGVLYSPRKQGAGVADVEKAVKTPAYIYVYGKDRTKLELGDDKNQSGQYSLTFHVKNMSAQDISYDVSASAMTEQVSADGKNMAQKGYKFDDADIRITSAENASLNGSTVKIGANKDACITVVVTLTDKDKQYMKDKFKNGIYVEGFASLKSKSEDAVDMSIPYLAFFGDWTKAAMLDSDVFDDKDPEVLDSYPLGVYAYFYTMKLGAYAFKTAEGVSEPKPSAKKIAIGLGNGNGISGIDYVALGLMRGAKNVRQTITDKDTGKLLAEYNNTNVRKASYNQNTGAIYPSMAAGSYPKSGTYARENSNSELLYSVKASLDYPDPQKNDKDTWTFPVSVDYEYPSVEDSVNMYEKDGRTYVDVKLSDNKYLMASTLYSYYEGYDYHGSKVQQPGENYYDYMTQINNSEPYKKSEVTFDITDFKNKLNKNKFYIVSYDYALNESVYLVEFPEVKAEGLKLDKDSAQMKINETIKLTPKFTPDNATNKNVTWTSSDEKVAIVKDGEVTALTKGNAVIKAKSEDGNFEAQCSITVSDESLPKIQAKSIKLDKLDAEIAKGSLFKLTASFEPWNTTAKEITWTSSDENTASVKDGVVTGKSAGSAEITAKAESGITASCKVKVKEAQDEFVISSGVLTKYNGTSKNVTIPSDVNSIGEGAFENNTSVEKVIFPENLKSIGKEAFSGCSSLTEVNFPKNLETIGDSAFYRCSKVKEVSVPKSVKSLEYACFAYMNSLEKAVISDGVKDLGTALFSEDTSLKDVTLPDNITKIPTSMFINCSSLSSIDIKKASIIEMSSFEGTGFSTFTVPETVKEIGKYAFSRCRNLKSVDFKGEVEGSEYMFYSDSSLTEVTGKLKSIPKDMFYYCTALTKFTIPSMVKSLGEKCFASCSSLNEIVIPRNSQLKSDSFGTSVFDSCKKLAKFTVEDGNSNLSSQDGILFDKDKKTVITAPCALKETEVTLPDATEEIAPYAFYKCSIKNITFSKNLKDISDYAFSGCSSLIKADIPDSVEKLGDYSFYGCSSLNSISFGKGLKSIGKDAFSSASSKLKEILIPDSVESIGESAFNGCKSAETIKTGNGLTVIPDSAFYNCNAAKNIVLSNKLKTIEKSAFYGGRALLNIDFPATLETIGERAFYGCYALQKIKMPDSLKSLGDYSFMNGRALSSIDFGRGIEKIGKECFASMNAGYSNYGCSAPVKSVYLPASLKSIDRTAFDSCSYLESIFVDKNNKKYVSTDKGVLIDNEAGELLIWPAANKTEEFTIPDTMTSIPADTFEYKKGLKKVIVPGSVNKVGTFAFTGSSVEEVVFMDSTNNGLVIANNAFSNAENLKSVKLPYGLTELGDGAFDQCENLNNVVLPDTLTTVGDRVFRDNVSLSSIKMSKSLSQLSDDMFDGCVSLKTLDIGPMTEITMNSRTMPFGKGTSLTAVNIDKNNPYCKSIDGVVYDKAGKEVLYYPEAKEGADYTVPEGVARVGSKAFSYNNNLTTVSLPSSLKRIGDAAFLGCYNLKTYRFNSKEAPELEVFLFFPSSNLGWYGNFYDYYFDFDDNNKIVYKDFDLKMYYPDGGTGYDSKLYNIFFKNKVETTPENMLSVKNLKSSVSQSHEVKLTWDKPEWAEGYKVERALVSEKSIKAADMNTKKSVEAETETIGKFETLGSTTVETYSDKTALFGRKYIYRVTAFKDNGSVYGPSSTSSVYVTPANDNEKTALAVINMIDCLPDPSAVSLDDKDQIKAALNAYGALTDAQKSLVYNYDKLASDEKALTVFVKQDNDRKAAKAVSDMIAALPNPASLKDEDAVKKAREAYDKLTDEQKSLVENYDVLVKDIKAIDDLKKQSQDNPKNPDNPGNPDKPGNPQKTDNPQKPADSNKPSGSGKPLSQQNNAGSQSVNSFSQSAYSIVKTGTLIGTTVLIIIAVVLIALGGVVLKKKKTSNK